MQSNRGSKRAFKANGDLSAKQYYILAADTVENQVVLANAQTVPIIGTLENAPVSGDVADVLLSSANGTRKVYCGGTIAIGDYITADSSGKAITTTSAGDMVIGRALQVGAASKIIEIANMFFRY